MKKALKKIARITVAMLRENRELIRDLIGDIHPELWGDCSGLWGDCSGLSRHFAYRFTVVDQLEPNAFAVPGGYVYVSRGLLALAKSEDEIAGVIAHEIQHVERRHSVKQMRKEFGLGLLALPGQLVGGIVSEDLAALAGKPFEAVAAGYSRDQEREADTLGQPLAAAAGYDPKAMAARVTDVRPGRRKMLRRGSVQ